VKDTTAGVINLTGGEVIAGNIESVTYDATIGKFHLVSYSDPIDGSITTAKLAAGAVTSPKLALGVWTTVASAATIDLGAQTSLNLVITGTTAITSFGATAVTHGSVYRLRFAAALTLTNGANLILPTAANIVTSAGDIAEVSYDGASVWRVLNYSRADGTIVGPVAISKITATGTPTTTTYLRGDSTWSAISIAPDIIIEDQKSSGTNGGSGTGGVWNTRTLNTVVRNNVSGASLASNQITLPAGTYYCAWSAPGVVVSNHKTRLRNATTSTDIAYGTSERTDSVNNVGNRSFGSAYITFSATALVAVDHYITQSSGVGLGQSVAIAGIIETYARIEIWKVA
jgi:hypothetical protein